MANKSVRNGQQECAQECAKWPTLVAMANKSVRNGLSRVTCMNETVRDLARHMAYGKNKLGVLHFPWYIAPKQKTSDPRSFRSEATLAERSDSFGARRLPFGAKRLPLQISQNAYLC